jgi:uncharacterized membrane protein YphA (DoxX/SURF4 family)
MNTPARHNGKPFAAAVAITISIAVGLLMVTGSYAVFAAGVVATVLVGWFMILRMARAGSLKTPAR